VFRNARVPAAIKRIVDGDTLEAVTRATSTEDFASYIVRLHGCDAPETRSKDPSERIAAQHATVFLQTLLPVGTQCTLLCAPTEDKYGRLLADVFVSDEVPSVTAALIAAGHAVPYNGGTKKPFESKSNE
jgi:micrococcal nuclease